ncbi:MAG: PEP/pyruvate-binding domain-containing protein [Clostridia bacterium]|nr:PEP/pyruvate-binding domain-containing protein [Clostridia bacterium]
MGKKVILNKYIIKEGTLFEMGEKGYNLNLLRKKNIKVPNFFCFNSRAFEEALDFRKKEYLEKVAAIDFKDDESIASTSKEIVSKIKQIRCFEFEDKINVYLREKYNEEDLFVVRSSSTYEDMNAKGEERLFEQFVDVKRSEVFDYVKRCWYSVYSEKSLRYFHEHKIEIKDVRMAVLIQKVEKTDISGIAFTSNPKGLINELVVVVGDGTSEDILDRKVDSTSYHYNKDDRVIFYERTNRSRLLDKKDLRIIIEEVLKIQDSFGLYTEIQWSLCGEELYILQAKKILSIDEKAELLLLNNKDIVDKFPGVILPLTESFARYAYAGVLKNIAQRTLPNPEVLKKYEENFNNMIYCVNGRMYCDVANWNLFLQFIPQSDKVLFNWQKKMGLLDETKKNKPKKGFERKLTGSQNSQIAKNSKRLFKNNRAVMEAFINEFNLLNESFTRKYRKDLTNKELIELYKEYVAHVFGSFDLTFINEIYTYRYLEMLKEKLRKVKVEDKEGFVTEYISDIYNNETEKFLRDLFEIANMVNGEIEAKLLTLDTNPKVRNFLYEETEFSNKLRVYVKDYGDIVLDSLKLESTTFKSNPKLLIDKILEYVQNRDKVRSVQGSLMNYENKDLPLILKKKTDMFNRSDIKSLEKVCREVVGYKEASETIRAKLYDMVRVIFNAISKNLYNEGAILSKNDIYYLKIDEIIDMVEGKEINLKEIALGRRREYACYFRLPSYSKLTFSNGIYNKYHINVNYFEYDEKQDTMKGEALSAGIAEKEVVVVYTKEDLKDIKDKIIVAETTDFGWFLDIAFSAGIITEHGSMFSGTAVLARDLGIPYISGIKNATSIFRTGEKIKLDADIGKITVIKEENKEK